MTLKEAFDFLKNLHRNQETEGDIEETSWNILENFFINNDKLRPCIECLYYNSDTGILSDGSCDNCRTDKFESKK